MTRTDSRAAARLAAGFALAALAAPAAALPIEIPLRDAGNYQDDGFHNPSNTIFGAGKVGTLTARNFFVFDLAGLAEPIGALSLSIASTGSYITPDTEETVTFFSYEGDPGFLINGTSGLANYADLGDGAVYGSLTVATPVAGALTPMPAATISLNEAAVAAVNAIIAAPDDPGDVNDKLFAVGGDLGTAPDPTQGVWFVDSDAAAVTLTGAPAAIPLPGALPLAAAGLGALGWMARRRRRPAA